MTKREREDRAFAKALNRFQKRGCDLRLSYTDEGRTSIAVEVDGVYYGVWNMAKRRWIAKGERMEVFNFLLSQLSQQGTVEVRYMDGERLLAYIDINGRYVGTWNIPAAAWVRE